MDAYYGEVETSGNIAGKTFYDFRLLPAVENADNDSFRYAEIVVPQGFVAAYNDSRGIHVLIPYTPDTRHLMVRFVIESGSRVSDLSIFCIPILKTTALPPNCSLNSRTTG